MKGKFIDMTGQQFGKLTVVERALSPAYYGRGAMWRVQCDCGTEKVMEGIALRSGATSCGCGRGRKAVDPDAIDPDALTTDPEVRLRQLNLELYSARRAAENAGAVYVRAVRRMRQAEINMSRAVNERRQRQI